MSVLTQIASAITPNVVALIISGIVAVWIVSCLTWIVDWINLDWINLDWIVDWINLDWIVDWINLD